MGEDRGPRRARRGRALGVLLLTFGLWAFGADSSALAAEPTYQGSPVFQGSNACPTFSTYGDQHICSGEVASFDGTLLDTDLTLPAHTTGTSHPLIIMLNGFGGTKHEWESTTNEGDGGDKYNWNTHWFSQHGYYVLTYTPRGFTDPGPDSAYQPNTPGGSSGFPASGPRALIHLKSRDTEIKDTQWLAALVADSFADVDPSQVAVTGGSYGGGESWLQASQASWTFPQACSNPDLSARPDECQAPTNPSPVAFSHALPALQLQVAVPKYPWTDLAYSLAPNGHPGAGTAAQPLPAGYCDVDPSLADDPCYSSSQGDPNSDTGSGNPFGVVKLTYTGLFFGYANGASNGTGFQVEDPCDTPPAPASVVDWAAFAVGTGEPYDVAGVETPVAAQVRHGLTVCRLLRPPARGMAGAGVGAAPGGDLLHPGMDGRPLHAGRVLPPVQVPQVARSALAGGRRPRRRGSSPGQERARHVALPQPAGLAVPAVADQRQSRPADDRHQPGDRVRQSDTARSQPERDRADTRGPLQREDLDHVRHWWSDNLGPAGSQRSGGRSAAGLRWRSDHPGPERELPDLSRPGALHRAVAAADQRPHLRRAWLGHGALPPDRDNRPARRPRLGCAPRSEPGPGGLAGVPHQHPPPGCPLLITRGTYRLDVPYDMPAGQIRIPLFGNHYKFRVGHMIRLDLTQNDAPYLRLSNVPSSIAFDAPTLTLPTRQSETTDLAPQP